jgi:pimeloyl-ACP methyl ester carboxylesterase
MVPAMLVSPAAAFDIGPGQVEAAIDGEGFEIFTYRPAGCAAPSVLMVFHGNGRTAESYRNSAEEIADRGCFSIYTPLFERDRFPSWSYHRGGIVQDGKVLPHDEWTVDVVDDLLDWARDQEGRPEARGFLFGHSAGGQFLSRVAAYALPEHVERIVIANPSTYVMPSTEEDVPYGFGGLPEGTAREWLQTYLAAPVTIYLGLEDTGDEDLTMTEAAQRQGENRLERGQHVFDEARRVADENGWDFNWQLVYAEDVGHTARGMLTSEEIFRALGF